MTTDTYGAAVTGKMDIASGEGRDAFADLICNALGFAFFGAGEGFAAPEDFLFEFSERTGERDWETLPERARDAFLALTDRARHLARLAATDGPLVAIDALTARAEAAERERDEARAEVERLREELSAANGYLLNAKIDLETGAPKRTAIATIEGGLKRVRAALQPKETTDE